MYGKWIGLKIFNSKIRPISPNHHLSSFDMITNLFLFKRISTEWARKFKWNTRYH